MQCFCLFLNWGHEKVLQENFEKDFIIVNDRFLPYPWSVVVSSRVLFWVAHLAIEAHWLWGFTCWKSSEGKDWTSSWKGRSPLPKLGKNRHSCLVHPQPWQHLCLLFPNGIEKFENNIYCLVAIPALSAGHRNGWQLLLQWE